MLNSILEYKRLNGEVPQYHVSYAEKVEKLLYETKNNVKTESIKDMLTDIVQNNSRYGEIGIPDFSSGFQFQDGALSVMDGGFSVDMEALADSMRYNMPNKYDYYKYKFDRIL